MSHGGARPGGGRPKGSRNKRTLAVDAAIAAAAKQLHAVIPNAFRGDAHTYLMSIYKDPTKSDNLRTEAARAALPYERPRLNSVEVSTPSGSGGMFLAIAEDAERFTQEISTLVAHHQRSEADDT